MPTYSLRTSEGDTFLDQLLHSRGIITPEDKQAFLSPSYDRGVHDPYLLKDMQKVVDRIVLAVKNNEKICIYSDFDADGIPGGVIFHDFFKKILYSNFINYIPHRHREGFGVHIAALEEIAKQGASLVITIDCGITDVAAAKRAKELGFDLIITDHHSPAEVLPDAYAIINPKQPGCEYPEKMLCGAGVIFKVVQALCLAKERVAGEDSTAKEKLIFDISTGWEKWLLDMVGLATLSDMVPLLGENRIFAYYGLMVLRKTKRPGLLKLFKSLKMNQLHLTEEDVAFMITPRINAASRMADPRDAFVLLSTTSETEAEEMTKHLNTVNDSRKTQVAHLVKQIKKTIEERGLQEKALIALGNPDWKPPVLGLAATHIVKEYGKPVFLWGRADDEEKKEILEESAIVASTEIVSVSSVPGIVKGSCRGPEGFNVVQILRGAPADYFLNMGGHSASGGFAVSEEKIHSFEQTLLDSYTNLFQPADASVEAVDSITGISVSPEKSETTIYVDKMMHTREVSRMLWSQVEKASPYGEAHPKPLFMLKSVTVVDFRIFGKTKEHVEISITHDSDDFAVGFEIRPVKAIQFFAASDKKLLEKAKVGQQVDLIAHLEKSMFRGFPEYRLRIVDIL